MHQIIYVPRTLMQRLRVIAPLVASTLYNFLWSDSCSGHFTQLLTYVLHEQQFLASADHRNLGWNVVCFYSKQFICKQQSSPTWFEELQYTFQREAWFTMLSVDAIEIQFVTAYFVQEFSCCVPGSLPLYLRLGTDIWVFKYSAV
jgi:hypothetical protein